VLELETDVNQDHGYHASSAQAAAVDYLGQVIVVYLHELLQVTKDHVKKSCHKDVD
jgi:hypothetical protein